MTLSAVELTPRTGAELKISKADLLSGHQSRDIRNLLAQRGVIIARDLHLTDNELRAFARSMGDLRLGTVKKEGEEGLMKVTMDPTQNPEYAKFFFGSQLWHMDGTYEEVPPFATMLTPRVPMRTPAATRSSPTRTRLTRIFQTKTSPSAKG